jgi:hypothetical protein
MWTPGRLGKAGVQLHGLRIASAPMRDSAHGAGLSGSPSFLSLGYFSLLIASLLSASPS